MGDEYNTLLKEHIQYRDLDACNDHDPYGIDYFNPNPPRCNNGAGCKYKRHGTCKFFHDIDDVHKCSNCGDASHHACICPQSMCHYCGQKGHMASACRTKEEQLGRSIARNIACFNVGTQVQYQPPKRAKRPNEYFNSEPKRRRV